MGFGSMWGVVLRFRSAKAWIAGVLAATLGMPFLYSAAILGIAARPWGESGVPRPGGDLDYNSRLIATLPPLRAGFLESVLGRLVGVGGSSGEGSGSPRDRSGTPLGSARAERTIDRHVEDLSNDDVNKARVIPSVPYTAHANTNEATRPPSDPDSCGSVGGTVWYRFRPAQTMLLAAYTFGTDHSIDLGVFRQNSSGALVNEACDRDAGGNAYISFQATAGATYYFQIAAPVRGGRLIFSLDPHGTFTRATVASGGGRPDADIMYQPAISDDGRYVAFDSFATNMPGRSSSERCGPEYASYHPPWADCAQVYVHDAADGSTQLISKAASGELGNSQSSYPNLSSDGRFVVFDSLATNLGTGPHVGEVFVYDRLNRKMEAIPTGRCTSQGVQNCYTSISDDGRLVLFQTRDAFIPQDTNNGHDVYIYDRQTRKHELVSVDNAGRTHPHVRQDASLAPGAGTGALLNPAALQLSASMTGDGRFVVFNSQSPLVAEDGNGTKADVYLRDRRLGRTERVSVSYNGGDLDQGVVRIATAQPTISDDGRFVVYGTTASNAVEGDNNGFNDIFVRDRLAKRNTLVSGGFNSPAYSGQVPIWPSISGDGRYVAYESNPFLLDGVLLVQEIAIEAADVYRYDLHTDTTTIITQTLDGEDSWGGFSRISGDGRSIVFMSVDTRYAGDTTCIPGGYHPIRCRNLFVHRAPR